jgi:radical SAM protein with 4Fe4S-binding SPASM domain
MFTLSPATVLRPEPHGALMFQQETAETALLDLEGLEALYFLLKGELRDYPVFFVGYLLEKGFIAPGPPDGALERVEAVRDVALATTAPPRSLTTPETIHFSVTGRCDQACVGCFYSARPGSQVEAADAPFSLFEKVVSEAGRARVFQMALGGGEPLLHPCILDMVRLAREHGIVPNLTTNGNLLDGEMAAALKEAGVGQVQISLNGVTGEANRKTRPNFQATMAAIEACRQADLRWGPNFLVTRSNLAELKPVIELGRSLGAASVNILRPKPPTTESDWLERESLDAEGYRQVQKILNASRRSQVASRKSQPETCNLRPGTWDLRPGTCNLKPETKITLDASLTFLLTDRSPEELYRAGVWGCSAARKFVTITQDGAVLPCSHVRWSDVGEGDFMRAWWESAVFARFRAQEEEMGSRCRGCPYLELCKGCRAVVMAFGGDFTDSDPHCSKVTAG